MNEEEAGTNCAAPHMHLVAENSYSCLLHGSVKAGFEILLFMQPDFFHEHPSDKETELCLQFEMLIHLKIHRKSS